MKTINQINDDIFDLDALETRVVRIKIKDKIYDISRIPLSATLLCINNKSRLENFADIEKTGHLDKEDYDLLIKIVSLTLQELDEKFTVDFIIKELNINQQVHLILKVLNVVNSTIETRKKN